MTLLLITGKYIGGYMGIRYVLARWVYKNTHEEICDAINKEGIHWTIYDKPRDV